jgi:glycosyltransferase involved in cell wall biosynthesis
LKLIQLIQKPQRRGAEIFAAQLSEQLRLSGQEVLLVSIFEGDSDLPFTGELIKLNRPISNRFFDFKAWSDFAKIVKRFNPEFIQANAADTLKFSVFSKIFFGWKTPIIYRNANQMGDFIRNGFHRSFNQWLLNQVSGIVSVSEASKANLHQTFRMTEDKSMVIPIGIDPLKLEKGIDEKSDLTLAENYLLQIGGLVPEKDPLGMFYIFLLIYEKYPNLNLVFLGDGPLKSDLLNKIKAHGLEDSVQLIPSQHNIFPILAQAKALVMPSKIEGLPGVILESMYCRVPVIAYSVGGISEVLTDQTGWLIPADDQKAFAKAIDQVLQLTETEKNQITERAFQLVSTDFTIKKIATQFERFYSGMIARIETKNDST